MNCRKAIAVLDELQKSGGPGTNRALTAVLGSSVAGRGSSCKPSRERMCPGAMSEGVRDARWTQIDAIARADVPWKPVEWRLSCQMNCRKADGRAMNELQKIPNIGLCPKTDSGKTLSSLQNYFWEKVQYGSASMIMK